ncbi:MAG: hypothetical protein L0I24_08360 [Pseudonocardia sp.]|nr:hypothetical protein [Pseudonocardia sp.]
MTPLGWILTVLGVVLAGIAVIKLSVVGYYPEELPPYAVLALVGAGLLWAARRWGQAPV